MSEEVEKEVRREAERLAKSRWPGDASDIETDVIHARARSTFEQGYVAGIESMRAEVRAESALRQMDIKQCMRLDAELGAERKRSANLVAWIKRAEDEGFRALRDYLRLDNPEYSMFFDTVDVDPSDFANGWCCNLKHAIAEYEEASLE